MKQILIGIAGTANSGKDTVASMINYIHHYGVTKASYSNWLASKILYDDNFKHRIIHFADALKDCLSIMYNIPREYFDDRKKKDEEYYLLNERRFVDKNSFKDKYYEITFESLGDYSLNEIIYDDITNIGIKLRTLMQYFGTNICRNLLDMDIWVKSTIYKAVSIAEKEGICIIPDVRFENEARRIIGNSLYGGVIKVNRDGCDKSEHESEIIDFPCSITIENNKTKMQLFYKVLEAYKQLIK